MKKIGLLAVMMFCARLVFAQLPSDAAKVERLRSYMKVKVGGDSGFEWEQKIDKRSVVTLMAGMSLGFQSDGEWINFYKAPLIFTPLIYAEYRNYYNLSDRLSKLKCICNNSANFFYGGMRTYYALKNQNSFGLAFVQGWGIQRSLVKHINMDLHLGITEHFYYDKPPTGGFNYLKFELQPGFSFSYVFD